jgi:hypothetical protein
LEQLILQLKNGDLVKCPRCRNRSHGRLGFLRVTADNFEIQHADNTICHVGYSSLLGEPVRLDADNVKVLKGFVHFLER